MARDFVCPKCRQVSLSITHSLELPPDGRSDEITLQLVVCSGCGFEGTAVYEESRRGATESWHHDGYRISPENLVKLKQLMGQCPSPGDKLCLCASHRALKQVNVYGMWQRPFPAQPSPFTLKFL